MKWLQDKLIANLREDIDLLTKDREPTPEEMKIVNDITTAITLLAGYTPANCVKWIKCSDRMPEYDDTPTNGYHKVGRYLIIKNNGYLKYLTIGWLYYEQVRKKMVLRWKDFDGSLSEGYGITVTHWAELPELPELPDDEEET